MASLQHGEFSIQGVCLGVWRRLLAFCLIVACLALVSAPRCVRAGNIPWPSGAYAYAANNEDLATFLKNFFESRGIGVVCSKSVTGSVNGRFQAASAEAFFKDFAKAFNLAWFYDGTMLYIYTQDEIKPAIIKLKRAEPKTVRDALVDLGIFNEQYPWRMVSKTRMISVAGPERYLALVQEVARAIDENTTGPVQGEVKDRRVIRVFPLRYAWASDLTFTFGDKNIVTAHRVSF